MRSSQEKPRTMRAEPRDLPLLENAHLSRCAFFFANPYPSSLYYNFTFICHFMRAQDTQLLANEPDD